MASLIPWPSRRRRPPLDLLGDKGPLARQLGEPSQIFRGDRARSDGARDDVGHLRPLSSLTPPRLDCDLCHGCSLRRSVQSEEAQYEHHHDDKAHKVNDAVHVSYSALIARPISRSDCGQSNDKETSALATWFLRRSGRKHCRDYALADEAPIGFDAVGVKSFAVLRISRAKGNSTIINRYGRVTPCLRPSFGPLCAPGPLCLLKLAGGQPSCRTLCRFRRPPLSRGSRPRAILAHQALVTSAADPQWHKAHCA
jgi:hypothetical protein